MDQHVKVKTFKKQIWWFCLFVCFSECASRSVHLYLCVGAVAVSTSPSGDAGQHWGEGWGGECYDGHTLFKTQTNRGTGGWEGSEYFRGILHQKAIFKRHSSFQRWSAPLRGPLQKVRSTIWDVAGLTLCRFVYYSYSFLLIQLIISHLWIPSTISKLIFIFHLLCILSLMACSCLLYSFQIIALKLFVTV